MIDLHIPVHGLDSVTKILILNSALDIYVADFTDFTEQYRVAFFQ